MIVASIILFFFLFLLVSALSIPPTLTPSPPSPSPSPSYRGMDLDSLALGQRDALLVFRTLCKLAMKEGSEDLVQRTKALSLELIQVGDPTGGKGRGGRGGESACVHVFTVRRACVRACVMIEMQMLKIEMINHPQAIRLPPDCVCESVQLRGVRAWHWEGRRREAEQEGRGRKPAWQKILSLDT